MIRHPNTTQTILGANGIIATELAKSLMTYGHPIRLVSRTPRAVNAGDELMVADLTDPRQIDRAVAGSAVVYITIGFPYSAVVWKRHWPPFMQAVIDACARHESKLVFFDNNYMYGNETMPNQTELSLVAPSSKKGTVRAELVRMVLEAIQAGRITGLIARSAEFYGPNIVQRSKLMEIVYENLKKGKPANWFVNADRIHTFTYAPDAARATAQLGNTPDAYGQVWHLPTTKELMTGKDWVALFAREMGQSNKLSVLPVWMLSILGMFIPFLSEVKELAYMWNQDYVFKSDKFEQWFGWSATSPVQAVRETVAINSQVVKMVE